MEAKLLIIMGTCINEFYHFFQPIYDIQKYQLVGFEALLRTEHYSNPEDLFNKIKEDDKLYELDLLSIHKALSTYNLSNGTENLYLNIYPSTILNAQFSTFLNLITSDKNLSPQKIVFEISENEQIVDFELFKFKILEMKKLGFLFAIDDLGKGYANLQTVIELEPDFIKLDRFFSIDLHKSKQKQLAIKILLKYSSVTNCKIILEGIENDEVLQIARMLGIKYAQGFHLGKPAPLINYLHKSIVKSEFSLSYRE